MFALHYYKPTPIYVMDEINAALDFKNVKRSVNEVASEHAVYISAEVKEEDRGSPYQNQEPAVTCPDQGGYPGLLLSRLVKEFYFMVTTDTNVLLNS